MKLTERTKRYLTKLSESYRTGGIPKALGVGAGTFGYLFGKYVFDSTDFVLLRHSGVEETIAQARVPITVKIIDASYLDEIARLNGFEKRSFQYRRLERFFRLGSECFGAFCEGTLICTGWGLHQADYYRAYDLTVRPGRGEVVLSGGLTLHEYRGRHVRECLLGHQLAYYRSRGLRCIVAIQPSNRPSLRAFSRYSFEQYGMIRKLRILGIRVR